MENPTMSGLRSANVVIGETLPDECATSHLLPMCRARGSLFCGACGCAGDAQDREPANVLENAGSSMDGAVFIRTQRRTRSNGCDTAPRS